MLLLGHFLAHDQCHALQSLIPKRIRDPYARASIVLYSLHVVQDRPEVSARKWSIQYVSRHTYVRQDHLEIGMQIPQRRAGGAAGRIAGALGDELVPETEAGVERRFAPALGVRPDHVGLREEADQAPCRSERLFEDRFEHRGLEPALGEGVLNDHVQREGVEVGNAAEQRAWAV